MSFEYVEVVLQLYRQSYYGKQKSKPDDVAFQVVVKKSPLPMTGGAFLLNTIQELENFQDKFTTEIEEGVGSYRYDYFDPEIQAAKQESDKQVLQQLGADFFALLPEGLRNDFQQLIQYLFAKSQRGLRLIIEASAKDNGLQLLALPWELAFTEARMGHLAQSERIVIVRRLTDTVRRESSTLRTSHRVLHVVATAPKEPNYKTIVKLGEAEKGVIEGVVGEESYSQIANYGSLEQTEAALTLEKNYSILHFTGDGNYYPNLPFGGPTGAITRSFLTFFDKEQQPQAVSGERLRYSLNQSHVQIVLLNACHGSLPTAGSAAIELVYAGTPYVVAMQGNIQVKAAEKFCHGFYQSLKMQQPIEIAVAAGRSAIVQAFPGAVDWCLPTLYATDGVKKPKAPEAIGEEIAHNLAKRALLPIHAIGSALLLFVSLLLSISNQTLVPPDGDLLAVGVSWTFIIPIVVGISTYWFQLRARANELSVVPRTILARMTEAAFIGFGFGAYFGWAALLLSVAVGFWALLSPVAMFILTVPLIGLATLISYSQALTFGKSFLDHAQLDGPPSSFFLPFAFLGMALFLYGPLYLFWYLPFWVAPPLSTFIVGGVWAVFAILLYREGNASR